jgi:hypothetical protein
MIALAKPSEDSESRLEELIEENAGGRGGYHDDVRDSSRDEWEAVQTSLGPWTTAVVKGKSKRHITAFPGCCGL